jgi:geranyl-CoA carboxylase alpha subunit
LMGGGGRGMRLVPAAADFPQMLGSARSEAASAFGDDAVIIEKAVTDARHVEIQVFGDRHGKAIHLGERDCSVQRRHQKLIEEAPSPALTPQLRAAMGEVSTAAVRAIAYEGAGTLEYLLDSDGAFYFMEMNTRLQVEHTVTEAITGIDLVELQLRIAAGEPIGIAQEDVRFDGHAIEARLCAEDPAKGFLPQSGRIGLWRMPPGLRVDTAMESGADVSPHHDSMIAKLVSHGATREEARRKLLAGLEDCVALGLPTNRAFLHAALSHRDFAAGQATTGFVAEHGSELTSPSHDEAAAIVAAVLLRLPPSMEHHGLPMPFAVPLRFALDGQPCDAGLTHLHNGEIAVEMAFVATRFSSGGTIRFISSGAAANIASRT